MNSDTDKMAAGASPDCAPSNPAAFPNSAFQNGMSLRDWFAGQAPQSTDSEIATQESYDRGRNPYNDPHKPRLRSRQEIVAFLRYRHADAMLAERERRS